jgi:hypothetical protein
MTSSKIEELRKKFEDIKDLEDIGEKRYQMFKLFDEILSILEKESVSDLDGFDGYLYKLSQDFLTSSSTYEKKQKMENILNRVEKKYSD